MVVDVAQLDHCSVQWCRVVAVSQHALRAVLHIVICKRLRQCILIF